MKPIAIALALGAAGSALAGGSNYNVTPGALAAVAGKVTEWDVPTPKFARDPAPAPDGSLYITEMHANKIARFDPATRKFREWDLPPGAKPHGLIVDKQGIVYYTGRKRPDNAEDDAAEGEAVPADEPSPAPDEPAPSRDAP